MKNEILIIGRGRAARHFKRYLSLEKIPFLDFDGSNSRELERLSEKSRAVFVLLKDDDIGSFLERHAFLSGKKVFHFSGARSFKNALSLHPLISFPRNPLPLRVYRKMIFSSENPAAARRILPDLRNKIIKIKASEKPLYHALCCVMLNFPQMLWRDSVGELSGRYGLPRKYLLERIRESLENFAADPEGSLTGPLVRKDGGTVKAHFRALREKPLSAVYRGFVKYADSVATGRTQ